LRNHQPLGPGENPLTTARTNIKEFQASGAGSKFTKKRVIRDVWRKGRGQGEKERNGPGGKRGSRGQKNV